MTEKTFNKHKLVIDEWFVNGMNGVRAYMKYYPKSKRSSADVSFRTILEIPRIEEYIRSKQQGASEELRVTHQEVLQELRRWAYSDITETLLLTAQEIKELPEDVRRLISSFKRTVKQFGNDYENTEEAVEVKFVSKERAMEMINKHIGFYEMDNKQKLPQMDYSNLSIEELITLKELQAKARPL